MCLPLPVDSELQALRCEINGLDAALDDLIMRRIRLGRLAFARRGGRSTDHAREIEILEAVSRRADGPDVARRLTAFHRQLFSCSKEAVS